MTTITTVGYGDKFPTTGEGRIIAAILMFSGVGLFGTLSGIVASFFLGQSHRETPTEKKLLAELADIQAKLANLRETMKAQTKVSSRKDLRPSEPEPRFEA